MLAFDEMERCPSPRLNRAIPAFCFGELPPDERDALALHLLECPACWAQVERLDACARAVRFDPRLTPMMPTPGVLSALALSGRLDEPMAGHRAYASSVSVGFGLLFAASVWTELSYSYDRHAALAWSLSPLALPGAAGALAAAMWRDARLTASGRTRGLAWSVVIALSALALLTAACAAALPGEATLKATFQVRSAAGGFQKNVVTYFIPLLLFLLPTFHVVVALQRELRAGRHKAVLDFLSNGPEGVAPRGVLFVPQWALLAILLVAAAIGYHGVNNMLDHLIPGPYANLFTMALYIRAGLWYVVALSAMAWYQRSLNELKREALAGSRLFARP